MGIKTISRDWGVSPSIVRVTTTDDLTTITTAGYLTTQASNINTINFGAFEWEEGDLVAIFYNGGEDYFLRDAVNNTFVLNVIPPGALPLLSGHIFVGNAANIATDVNMTGDIGIDNAGVTAIDNEVIVNDDINPAAGIEFSKLEALLDAQIIVGSALDVATAVDMAGDVTIDNAGITTIGNGVVQLAMLDADIAPSHIIKFAEKNRATLGGAAQESFNVPGIIAATDFAFVQITDNGPNNVTVVDANVTNNTLTITFSANPGANTLFNYQILRATN